MTNSFYRKMNISDKGETMVEVMVAFTVLLLVLALLTGAINYASSAQMNSIDVRRSSDDDFKKLHEVINTENITHTGPATDPSGNAREKNDIDTPIIGTDGDPITLSAYKYESGDSVYWIYR